MKTTNETVTTNETTTEFFEKASPILRDAYLEGWFSVRTGLALAQFDFQTQHNIVAALTTGHIPPAAVNRIADFLWRIYLDKPVTSIDVLRYDKLVWRVARFQEIFNIRVTTCDFCKKTGKCGGSIFGEPIRGRSRYEFIRYGHRFW
ncbi:MAG: hypothetical protein VB050_18295 [Geobacteraceae bacterium]|nr:hypothetical protein [Geobacteraceae bacterium]